jgi:hypothetical protein
MYERAVEERITCPRHPKIETHLRCGRCGTPICPKCLVYTPVGARCPKCAAPPRSLRGYASPVRLALAVVVGLAIGMVGGVALSFLQFGVLALLPLLLTGFLVGEAMSAVANRSSGSGLAVAAFVCTVIGPVLGRAALIGIAVPADGVGVRLVTSLMLAGRSMAGFELLLLLIAGVLAATRVRGSA